MGRGILQFLFLLFLRWGQLWRNSKKWIHSWGHILMEFCSILLTTTHSSWRWRITERQGVTRILAAWHEDLLPNWQFGCWCQVPTAVLQIPGGNCGKLSKSDVLQAFACKTCYNYCSYSQWTFLSLLSFIIWDY